MAVLLGDGAVIQRILDHIDRGTTDRSPTTWRVPVENYRAPGRLAAELRQVFRRCPTPLCPSAALPEPGSYLARTAAGTPLLAVRGRDGQVRVFRNACRHRGMEVAQGTGRGTAFVCRFHGWTYGLDGCLRHVPHEDGFPELDRAASGLVPVASTERHGLVFVTQADPLPADGGIEELAGVIPADLRLHATDDEELPVNWKILIDGYLEGYHLRPTHRDTFFPIQFDNLNVVESFGRNNRVAFPYRRIGKLRAVPGAERSATGVLTFLYHLFPNVVIATFPFSVALIVHEPLAVDRTQLVTYTLTAADPDDADQQAALNASLEFQLAGLTEDRAVAAAIQRGLSADANDHFTLGRYEGALIHFHRTLDKTVGAAAGP